MADAHLNASELPMASDDPRQSGDNGNGKRFLQSLMDTIPAPIFYKDLQGRYLGCNVAFAEFLGRRREEIIGKTVQQVWDRPSADTYSARDAEILREDSARQVYEYRTTRADGSPRDVLFHKAALYDDNGRINGLVGVMMDITDRKNAERQLTDGRKQLSRQVAERTAELRRSQERLKAILETTPDLVFVLNADGVYVDIFTSGSDLLVAQADKMLGRRFQDVLPPELVEICTPPLHRALETGQPQSVEYLLTNEQGEPRWQSASVKRFVYGGEDHAIVAVRDITERVEAEQAALKSEQQLRLILESTPDLMFVLDPDGRYVDIFTAESDLLAAPADKLIGNTIHEMLPEEVASVCQGIVDAAIATGEPQTHEYDLILPSGEQRWFQARVARFESEQGPRVIWTARDITDRVLAEQAARQSEQRFQEALQRSSHVLYRYNVVEDYYEYLSDCVEEMFGWPMEQALQFGKAESFEQIHPEDRPRVEQFFTQVWPSDGSRRELVNEYRRRTAWGHYIWLRDHSTPIFEDGQVVAVVGAVYDITDRKQAEQAARQSEQRFREALQRSSHVLYRYNAIEDHYEYLSDCVEDIFGWPKEEFLQFGKGETLEHTHPDDIPLLDEFTRKHFRAGSPTPQGGLEYRRKTASGVYIWLRDHPTPILQDGKLVAIVGSVYDITDQKRAEQAARQSEQRFREALRHSQSILYRYNFRTEQYEYVSDSVETFSGYSAEEFKTLGAAAFLETLHPEDRDEVTRQLLRQPNPEDRDQLQAVLEYRRQARGGEYRWFMDWATLFYEKGELVAVAGSAYDITDQRRAQQELREAHSELEQRVQDRTAELAASEERWRSIVETAPDYVLFVEPDGTVRYINRAYTGLSLDRVLGMKIEEFAAPEYRDLLNGELRKVIEGAESSGCEAVSAGITGQPRWFSVRFGPFRRDGEVIGATLIAQDITERKATEQALHDVQRRLMKAQEQERRRLAADLHDSVSQMLFALQMRLKRLHKQCDRCAQQQELETAIDHCNQLIHETRAVYRGLYPPGLVQLGLVSALRQLARDFQQTTEIEVTCGRIVQSSRFDDTIEIALFRIAQEAVRNALRHGHAETVEIDLAMTKGELALRIADDGDGFDVRQTSSTSLGLRTMQERAVSIGGTFSLESSPTGTTVEVSVPASPRSAIPES